VRLPLLPCFVHNGFVLDKSSRVLAPSAEDTRPEPPAIVLNWPALLATSK
jgi:hypothetical protein